MFNLQTIKKIWRPSASLQLGLISYWKFDESSGNSFDSVGSNTLTNNNGTTYTAAKIQNGLNLVAASSQYVSSTSNTSLQLGDIDFTFTCWINANSFPLSYPQILTKGWGGGGAVGTRELAIFTGLVTGQNYLIFSLENASSVTTEYTYSLPLSASTWYFIVLSYNSTTDLMSIQVNNGTIETTSHAGGTRVGSGVFQVGASSTQGLYWNGKIDELGFWKRILTEREKTYLYNNGNGITYPFIS